MFDARIAEVSLENYLHAKVDPRFRALRGSPDGKKKLSTVPPGFEFPVLFGFRNIAFN